MKEPLVGYALALRGAGLKLLTATTCREGAQGAQGGLLCSFADTKGWLASQAKGPISSSFSPAKQAWLLWLHKRLSSEQLSSEAAYAC